MLHGRQASTQTAAENDTILLLFRKKASLSPFYEAKGHDKIRNVRKEQIHHKPMTTTTFIDAMALFAVL